MHNLFDIRYKIQSTYNAVGCIIPLTMEIQEVINLYEVLENNKKKSLVITSLKWQNICIEKINRSNESTLISLGAELMESNHLFYDRIDAGIQMAFIASRADIKSSHIFEATRGIVTEQGYLQLQDIFYQDYPEKFI